MKNPHNWTMRNAIAATVVSIWVIVTLDSVVTSNYTPLGAVTPVMMIVVGFLFRMRPPNGEY